MIWVQRSEAFLRTVPKFAHALGLLAIIIWIFKALILDRIPEILPGMAALGKVFEGILSAFISGYVFYLLFALLPDYRARQVMAPFIFKKVRGIVGDCLACMIEIAQVSGQQIDPWQIDATQMNIVFTNTSMNTLPNATVNFAQATWMQFFLYRQLRTKDSITRLFNQGRFLDADIVDLLTQIDDCSFFNQVSSVNNIPIKNPNLGNWSDSFFKYLMLCRLLASWHDRNRPAGTQPLIP